MKYRKMSVGQSQSYGNSAIGKFLSTSPNPRGMSVGNLIQNMKNLSSSYEGAIDTLKAPKLSSRKLRKI